MLTWKTTHELDPYKPIESAVKPINVEVVALDWKWLFIYPDLGIASVNQLAFPVGTPVNFLITSDSVMNSFFIPQLGSQIYAMAGMQTQLHLVADEAGDYAGVSANFSGKGFSDMKFRALATNPEQFNAWVDKVKASSGRLDMNEYNAVAQPSEKEPVRYFSIGRSEAVPQHHCEVQQRQCSRFAERQLRYEGVTHVRKTDTFGDSVRSAHHHGCGRPDGDPRPRLRWAR